ncbi:hypothetical protein GVAV_000450 [Gurleya vavrai]
MSCSWLISTITSLTQAGNNPFKTSRTYPFRIQAFCSIEKSSKLKNLSFASNFGISV